MSQPPAPLVVIGLGSLLRADDAVGVRVVEALREAGARDPAALPDGTHLIDGGTLGPDLAGRMRGSRGLVLVDAIRPGGAPGSIAILRDEDADARGALDGTPGDPRGELLALARLMGWLPEEVALVGIEVADLGLGLRLSPAVAAAIPHAVDAVVAELHRIDSRTVGRFRGANAAHVAGAAA